MKIESKKLRQVIGLSALAGLGLLGAGVGPADAHPVTPAQNGYHRRTAPAANRPAAVRQHSPHDFDGDGIPNWNDGDVDGDGIFNSHDRNNYKLNHRSYRTTRVTRLSRWQDRDHDGIPNWKDRDIDGDGKVNRYDLDRDGDGVMNRRDSKPRDRRRN